MAMFNINNLNFDIGAFIPGASEEFARVDRYRDNLQLVLEIQPLSPRELTLQVSVENLGESQALYSLFVDFELAEFIPVEVLVNAWSQSGYSGYVKGIHPTHRKKVVFVRDQNPYSFLPEYGYVQKSQVSEWYTQLVGTHETIMLGALTTRDQFTAIYLVKKDGGTFVRIACQLDGTILPGREKLRSEKLYLAVGSREELLERFGSLLRKYGWVGALAEPAKGLCCAYYYQGNRVDEKYVLDQLQALDRLPCSLKLDYIQIDAGYAPWGDWFDTYQNFPSGMKSIVSEINRRGLKAGIWIAPFVASPRSKLFKEHREWFLTDSKGKFLEARNSSPFDSLPPLSLRVLDVTKPPVQAYITSVIEQFVEWGFEYIKTDFTYGLCFSTGYEVPMTRARALRLGFKVIKTASRGLARIESCITQLSPLVGLVDYVRTGSDTINPVLCSVPGFRKLVNQFMLQANLRNCAARQFLNGKVWINDPDCLVSRPNTGLSPRLIDRHFHFIKNYGGSIWVGDHLRNLAWGQYETFILDLFGYQQNRKTAISVVVPAWNEEKTIHRILDSLSAQKTEIAFEVILVDNNCTDDTVKIAEFYTGRINKLRVVCEKTQSIGAARNAGFLFATSELIASTDADTTIPEGWLSDIYERFWSNDNLAALVGTFIFYSKGNLYNKVVRNMEIAGDYLHKLIIGSFAFRGSNFAIRKSVWELAGGFNTHISALEDVDLSLRVGEIGAIGYAPNLTVATSFRRYEGRFLRQLIKRTEAYIFRVFLRNTEKYTDWEPIR